MFIQFTENDLKVGAFETFTIDGFKVNYFHGWQKDKVYGPDDLFEKSYRANITAFKSICSKDKISWDLGAGGFDTTSFMAPYSKRVIAFEPGPAYFYLDLNRKANPDFNVTCYNYGLNDVSGELDALYDKSGFNGGLVNPKIYYGQWAIQTKIRVLTFEEHIKAHPEDAKDIGLVKIDTESSDVRILNSFKQFIYDRKIVIYLEWWPQTHTEIQQLVNDLNYDVYDAVNLSKLSSNIADNKWRQDLILFPK